MRGRAASDGGSLSLELVLVVPVLALVVLGVLHVAVLGRDVLVVQSAARAGARAAATTRGEDAVREAVGRALGGRAADVTVTPAARRAGDLVRVRVSMAGGAGPFTLPVAGSAVARVEPTVGFGAGP